MKVEFSINNYVEFELTEYGAKILNDRDDYYAAAHPNVAFFQNKPKHVEGQTMKMQLWDVLGTFGEYTIHEREAFCKNATIVLNISKIDTLQQIKVLYAADINEDMSNAENWKVGDIIEATTQGYNNRLGVRYEVIQVNSEEIRYKCLEDGYCSEEFVDKDELGWLSANYKFIYRPIVN